MSTQYLKELQLLLDGKTLSIRQHEAVRWAFDFLSDSLDVSDDKPISFYVNGFEYTRYNTMYSYEDICVIAGYPYSDHDVSITYKNAAFSDEGSLSPTEAVRIQQDTRFEVVAN